MGEKDNNLGYFKQGSIEDTLKNDEIIGKTPGGQPLYRSDDPGEMYKINTSNFRIESKSSLLLDKTTEKNRYYLNSGTLVQQNENGKFRKGYLDEETIAERCLNKQNKTIINGKMIKYLALTETKFSFWSTKDNKHVSLYFKPGEKFFAPKSGENVDKKKEMLEKANKST